MKEQLRSHGVMVSTLDFESSDPSSNLGGTYRRYIFFLDLFYFSSFLSLSFSTIIGGKTYNKLSSFFLEKKKL